MSDYIWPESATPKMVKKAYGNKLCSFTICLEAWRRGLNVEIYDPNFKVFAIADKNKKVMFNRSKSQLTSSMAVKITKDKQVTREYFIREGVPTPQGACFEGHANLDAALAYAVEIGFPIVMKPLDGSLGQGVFTNINSTDEAKDIFLHLVDGLGHNKVIVEKFVSGDDYRIYVVGDKIGGVVKRIPANVVGDGVSTVSELIDKKNLVRKQNPFLSKGLIKVDKEILRYVKNAGLSLDSILSDNSVLFLRGKANASAGGDVIDVTDDVPDTLKEVAVKAVKSIPELSHCGVDVLFDDKSNTASVIEINSRAQVGVNMYPTNGVGRDIPRAIIDEHFPGTVINASLVKNNVVFDMDAALFPLRESAIRSVSLTRPRLGNNELLKHYYTLDNVVVDEKTKVMIAKIAEKHSVKGFVKSTANKTILLVCAGDDKMKKFISECGNCFSFQEALKKRWLGVVEYSFSLK
ncbi:ATP-grasp domain-containing protein [Halomonas venusta]|uniref:ATP-binding protein n=1 Tax=Vreelandella venusta TaxID=44935 RepID=UPI00295EAECB|nr:ATP-grasp domain-containing protein [Halomonas venusta]MDW0359737.1 ATP-grasp domain-containing protein [Halomonas venusta]